LPWKKKANAFATYLLTLFRPIGPLEDIRPQDFTYNALEQYIDTLRHDPSWLSQFRLVVMDNRLNGMNVKFKNSKLLNSYSGRNRTLWTKQQHLERHLQTILDQCTKYQDAVHLDPDEFNQEYKDLSARECQALQSQISDVERLAQKLESNCQICPTAAAASSPSSQWLTRDHIQSMLLPFNIENLRHKGLTKHNSQLPKGVTNLILPPLKLPPISSMRARLLCSIRWLIL
jgi:hypothetical protein